MKRKSLGILVWVALLGSASAEECHLDRVAQVELQVGDQVLFPARLNGHDFRVALYTAGDYSLISNEVVDALKLKRRALDPSINIFLGAQRATQSVFIDSLQIGNAELRHAQFVVDPPLDRWSHRPSGEVAANASLSVFGTLDVELDMAHRKLALYSPEHCPRIGVYWADIAAETPIYRGYLGNLYFPMELDGKLVEATFSAETATTSLEEMVSSKLYGFDRHSPGIEMRPGADGKPEPYYKAMKITAKGLAVTNADVRLKPTWSACHLAFNKPTDHAVGFDGCLGRYPLNLGRDVLEKLHLYFAVKEGVLFYTRSEDMTPAPAPAAPPTPPPPSQ